MQERKNSISNSDEQYHAEEAVYGTANGLDDKTEIDDDKTEIYTVTDDDRTEVSGGDTTEVVYAAASSGKVKKAARSVKAAQHPAARPSVDELTGKYGSRLLKGMICFLRSGVSLLMDSTLSMAKKRSFSRGVRI